MARRNTETLDQFQALTRMKAQYEIPDAKQSRLIENACNQLVKLQTDFEKFKQESADSKAVANKKEMIKNVQSALTEGIKIIDAVKNGDSMQILQATLSCFSAIAMQLCRARRCRYWCFSSSAFSFHFLFAPKQESLSLFYSSC